MPTLCLHVPGKNRKALHCSNSLSAIIVTATARN